MQQADSGTATWDDTIMDPSVFLPYTTSNGLPQESKLATYMNHVTSTPTRVLTHNMGNLSLQSSPVATKKATIGEFIPTTYYNHGAVLPDSPESSPPATLASTPSNTQIHQENVGGTTYFYPTSADSMNSSGVLSNTSAGPVNSSSPYASQIFTGTPTHVNTLSTKPGLAASFYMPDAIRNELYHRNQAAFMQIDMQQYPDLPETVEMYADLMPLEPPLPHGALATSFRVTHRQTGEHYTIRRLHAFNGTNGKRPIDLWKKLEHPNVVKLHEVFTTKTFGDHSMIFVYDYHPGSATLMSKYMSTGGPSGGGTGNNESVNGHSFIDPFSSDPDAPRPYTHQKNAILRAVACGALLPEALLWSLLVQLTAALRAIHSAGLACRKLDPTKVILSGCRARISFVGAADTLTTAGADVGQAQQDDLSALGRLALALACRSLHAPTRDNLQASLDLVSRTYSADLKNLILYLLSSTAGRRSVTDLMPMVGARFYTQVEALQRRADTLEDQLARELDNGRLLKLLIKLATINERPELNLDCSWAETGDRYMLKLFRDYLFHSVCADGRPWLDQAHLTHCLNQLDSGTHNKVQLMSRDEQSVLVVSYAELKHCLDQAFEEVMQAASPP